MVERKLVERSEVARKLGGPEFIRKLPLADRLAVCARVAKEVGNNEARKKCALRAINSYLSPEQERRQVEAAKRAAKIAEDNWMADKASDIATEVIEHHINEGIKAYIEQTDIRARRERYFKSYGWSATQIELETALRHLRCAADIAKGFYLPLKGRWNMYDECNFDQTFEFHFLTQMQRAAKLLLLLMEDSEIAEICKTKMEYELPLTGEDAKRMARYIQSVKCSEGKEKALELVRQYGIEEAARELGEEIKQDAEKRKKEIEERKKQEEPMHRERIRKHMTCCFIEYLEAAEEAKKLGFHDLEKEAATWAVKDMIRQGSIEKAVDAAKKYVIDEQAAEMLEEIKKIVG